MWIATPRASASASERPTCATSGSVYVHHGTVSALARARAHAFPDGVLASFDHRLARLLRRAARG